MADTITCLVNGEPASIPAEDADAPLLWILRDGSILPAPSTVASMVAAARAW